jgi:hypothetical protein
MGDCPESLEAPYVYVSENKEKWVIFPDSNPDPFKHPKACIDSMLSTCVYDKTLTDCIEVCESDKMCEFGYYVKGKNSVCLPLYTSDYYPEANPLLSIKNKKCFPETSPDGIQTASFMKSSKSDWLNVEEVEDNQQGSWPLLGRSSANAVYMGDKLLLSVKVNGEIKHIKMKGEKLVLDDEGTEFQIFNKYGISRDDLNDKVNFYDGVSFILGDTKSAIILEANSGSVVPKNHYNWVQDQETQIFQIIPKTSGKLCDEEKPSDCIVSYGDEFFLSQSDGFVSGEIEQLFNILYASDNGIQIFDDQHHPIENDVKKLLIRNLSDLSKDTPDGVKFFFTPTKTVYYCETKTNSCNPLNLSDATKIDKQAAYYNNNPLFLRKDCFGSCLWLNKQTVITDKLKDPSTSKGVDWNAWVLIFATVVIIATIILIMT